MTGNPQWTPGRALRRAAANHLAEDIGLMLLAAVRHSLAASAADLSIAELLALARILTAARRELPLDDDPVWPPAVAGCHDQAFAGAPFFAPAKGGGRTSAAMTKR